MHTYYITHYARSLKVRSPTFPSVVSAAEQLQTPNPLYMVCTIDFTLKLKKSPNKMLHSMIINSEWGNLSFCILV